MTNGFKKRYIDKVRDMQGKDKNAGKHKLDIKI